MICLTCLTEELVCECETSDLGEEAYCENCGTICVEEETQEDLCDDCYSVYSRCQRCSALVHEDELGEDGNCEECVETP